MPDSAVELKPIAADRRVDLDIATAVDDRVVDGAPTRNLSDGVVVIAVEWIQQGAFEADGLIFILARQAVSHLYRFRRAGIGLQLGIAAGVDDHPWE
ncbi:MAG: hypothetical protein AB1807_08645 [Pseudomonadota bacterium]